MEIKKLYPTFAVILAFGLGLSVIAFESYYTEENNKVMQFYMTFPDNVRTYLTNNYPAILEIGDNELGTFVVLERF